MNQFRNFNKGGILVYAMVLAVAFGFISISLLTPASFEGPKVAKEERNAQMFFAANSGLELLRGVMYYNTRTTFAGYLNENVSNTVFNFDGVNITFDIWNNEDDGWGGVSNDGDGILAVSSTAFKGKVDKTEAIKVTSQFMLKSTTKYSFASNQWGGGWMDGEQHWYGDVLWYCNRNSSHPQIKGKSYFHGDLTSWDFKLSQNKINSYYTDTFNTHLAYKRVNKSKTGYIYGAASPRNARGESQPIDVFTSTAEFKPLPGLNDIKAEVGLNKTKKGTIRHAAYNQLEKTPDGNYVHSHYFGAGGVGTVSGNPLPESAELFFHPNGAIWWRPRGGLPGTYNPDAEELEEVAKKTTPSAPGHTYRYRWGQKHAQLTIENDLKWRKSDLTQTDGLVIYGGRDLWVRGVVNKRMTIAAERDIYINGNIINSNWDYAHLVLIAKNDINEEVRKEYKSGSHDKILRVRSTGSTNVNVDNSLYIANRIFTDAEYSALYNDSNTPAWLKTELIRWKNYPGVLSDQAIIESSLIGNRICPTVYYSNFNYGRRYTYKYHSWPLVNGASWRVSGTYFIAGEPYDYVEHWSSAPNGKATYHEHIGANSAPPPFGITNNNEVPIYRLNGYFWRVERLPAPTNQ